MYNGGEAGGLVIFIVQKFDLHCFIMFHKIDIAYSCIMLRYVMLCYYNDAPTPNHPHYLHFASSFISS